MVQVKVALLKFRFPVPQNLKKNHTLRFDVYLENVKVGRGVHQKEIY